MVFIIIGIIIVLLFIFFNIKSKKSVTKKLEKIRNNWLKIKSEKPIFSFVSAYSNINKASCFHELSDQTMNDIDFYELFNFIDRTTSKTGQQFLFDHLKKPTDNIASLNQIDEHAIFFSNNQNVREEIQMLLLNLENHDAYYITNLLQEQLFIKPFWVKWVIADILVIIAMLCASPFYPILLIWLMLPFSINLFLHFYNKQYTYQFIKSFPQLNKLIDISKKISSKKIINNINKTEIEQSIKSLRTFQKKSNVINIIQTDSNDPAQSLLIFVDLIKAFFLLDVYNFYKLIDDLQNKQKEIDTIFRFVGYTDLCISVASLRATENIYCSPVFTDNSKNLYTKNIYHPLVKNCATNSISIDSKSILITGSNMSGKTTFLRSIAVNSLLAQTLFTCFAEEFHSPILKLFSSIRIDDNLLEGKSYYFEEVNIMSSLIQQINSGHQNIFILDEVFKGTNTIERMASGKAILSYLNKDNNIVLVATHDIELSDLLKNEYELYHFSETVQNNELLFDHILKAGKLTTRNAIKILEISGYPNEITDEANVLSKMFETIIRVKDN